MCLPTKYKHIPKIYTKLPTIIYKNNPNVPKCIKMNPTASKKVQGIQRCVKYPAAAAGPAPAGPAGATPPTYMNKAGN